MQFRKYYQLCSFVRQILNGGEIATSVGINIFRKKMLYYTYFHMNLFLVCSAEQCIVEISGMQLHRCAMKRTMLLDQCPTVYPYYLMIREGYP